MYHQIQSQSTLFSNFPGGMPPEPQEREHSFVYCAIRSPYNPIQLVSPLLPKFSGLSLDYYIPCIGIEYGMANQE